jgi:tRNA pseudouridine13 synthase
MSLPSWTRAYGSPLFAATIRKSPADFDVTEILGFDFDGEGEHDYLYIEKTAANTEWVSRQLANHAGVPARDVGYSGLKDRDAVTRQWFSVPRWNSPDWNLPENGDWRVLDVQRNSKKLRRGAHKANAFCITLRDIDGDTSELQERFDLITARGVPNYFGPQRFGRGGNNIRLADDWANSARLPRHKRSIAISSVRSFLFNEGLSQRVADGSWDRLLPGDMANLDGTGSIFVPDHVDDELERRCVEMDIHPAAELAGDGSGTSHALWQGALDKARVKAGSRSLRLRIGEPEIETATDSIRLSFVLTSGAFATSVLREICST